MDNYINKIVTKEELAEIIARPRIGYCAELENDLVDRTINVILNFSKAKFLKAAKRTNLVICSYGNRYAIRYEIN